MTTPSADKTEAAIGPVAEESPGASDLVERTRVDMGHGRPCHHRWNTIGDIKRGKTGAISLKGNRESDSLIVAKKPRRGNPSEWSEGES